MRAIATLLAAALLIGCTPLMTKVSEPQRISITWVRMLPVECGSVKEALGCAITNDTYDYPECLIIMPEDSPDWLVAHEFRHCFGYKHKE